MGRIVTFYSYKGGVGRTLALANIGVLLAKRGKKVLLMDWDLEAPGLDRYFRPYLSSGFLSDRGVIQLLHEAYAGKNARWQRHVQEISLIAPNTSPNANYRLSVIPSGSGMPNYADRVRDFSWSSFLLDREGGSVLDRWRGEWKDQFDFVFLDSRTGITDTGGICTIYLPDFLVLVFTANEQSLEGSISIAQSAQIERRNLAVARSPLTILPLLSRFDRRDEVAEADKWLDRCAKDLKPFFDDWLPAQFKPLQLIELTKIPYVSRFSFGEPLPVLTHSLTDPELPGFYLENAARLIATEFREAAQIIDPSNTLPAGPANEIRQLLERTPIDEVELRRLVQLAEQEFGPGPSLASLMNKIGLSLFREARYTSAELYFRRALGIDEKGLGVDHPNVARDLHNLAKLLQSTNRLREAEPHVRRALEIMRKSLGPEHPNVAAALNSLAFLLMQTNRYNEAELLFRQVLEIAEENLGREHHDVAVGLNNLARLFQDTNRYMDAESAFRRALEITEKSLGDDHPEVAAGLNNLALLLLDRERFKEAEPFARRALDILEKSLGPEHPDVAAAFNTLAMLLLKSNRYGEAEVFLRQALMITENSLGPEHPFVAAGCVNLASLLKDTNRYGEAEVLLRRAMSIDEKSLGSEHPEMAVALNNLSTLLQDMSRFSEAEPLMKRALEIVLKFTQSTGHEHPRLRDVAASYFNVLTEMSVPRDEIRSKLIQAGTEAGLDREKSEAIVLNVLNSVHSA